MQSHAVGVALPECAPTKDEAHGSEDTAGQKFQTQADCLIAVGESKEFSSIRAAFALRGYALHCLADGTYLICRWNYCRPLPDLLAARRMLRQIGGANV